MLLFGFVIDRFGRRIGVILTTLFLVLVSLNIGLYIGKTINICEGITLATASHGNTPAGMFWMMIICRGKSILDAFFLCPKF
jgi:MFS family permease